MMVWGDGVGRINIGRSEQDSIMPWCMCFLGVFVGVIIMQCFDENPLVASDFTCVCKRNKRLNLHTLSTWESRIKVNLVLV